MISSTSGETVKEKLVSIYNQVYEKFIPYSATFFISEITGYDAFASIFINKIMLVYGHSSIYVLRKLSDEVSVKKIDLITITS